MGYNINAGVDEDGKVRDLMAEALRIHEWGTRMTAQVDER